MGGQRERRKPGASRHLCLRPGAERRILGRFLDSAGLSGVCEAADRMELTNDESTVFLLQAEPEYLDPPYHRKRVGMNHLAFAVSSKQQVDALATVLVGRRVPMLYGGPRAGRTTYAVFFEDPDRIKIEVVAPLSA